MDRDAIRSFMGRYMEMTSGAALLAVVGIADRTGLFRALAGRGPLCLGEIAQRTGLDRRYLAEALSALAAAGIVRFDAGRETFALPDEHAACLADERSPYFLGGWPQLLGALYRAAPGVAEAFRSGGGVSYADFGEELVAGIDRTNGPGTRVLLVRKWLPVLPALVTQLEAGARVADVGCGSGAAALAMARGYPQTEVLGFDADATAIARARAAAAREGLANVRFEHLEAAAIPTTPPFDLITAFDVIHDLARPGEALRRIRRALDPGGTFLLVEPAAGDSLADNLDVRGALLYAMSTLHCIPVSRAQGGEALGAAWGPGRAEALCREAGFGSFRRLPIDNPFNAFYEVRA